MLKLSSFRNCRPMAILNNFSKGFEFIVRYNFSHFLKSNLNLSQHGFIKSKSIFTNVVTFLDFVSPLVFHKVKRTLSILTFVMLSTLFQMHCFFVNSIIMIIFPLLKLVSQLFNKKTISCTLFWYIFFAFCWRDWSLRLLFSDDLKIYQEIS
jgi:hypothetical protein